MISRYGWRGALVAIALAGCGADDRPRADEAPAPPVEGERGRVVFLGTSLTAGQGLDPEQAALQASLAPIVRDLFGTLSAPHAEALALHVVLGYTVGEIAALAEVPDETVRSRLRLAKQALRKRVMSHPVLREVVGGEP